MADNLTPDMMRRPWHAFTVAKHSGADDYDALQAAMNAARTIDDAPDARDDVVLAEAAFREGYDDGWCTGTAAMQEDRAWNCDADWERSNVRAALSSQPSQDVEAMREALEVCALVLESQGAYQTAQVARAALSPKEPKQ